MIIVAAFTENCAVVLGQSEGTCLLVAREAIEDHKHIELLASLNVIA